nr:MAG TPA: hypothetical protein [Caudoviricetes sp.]
MAYTRLRIVSSAGALVTPDVIFANVPFGTPDFSLSSSKLSPERRRMSLNASSHIIIHLFFTITISLHPIKRKNYISVNGNLIQKNTLTISEYGYILKI